MELNRLFEEVLNEVILNKDNTANPEFNLKDSVDEEKRDEASMKIRKACELVEEAHMIFSVKSKNPGYFYPVHDENNSFHKTFAKFEIALSNFSGQLRNNRLNEDRFVKIFSNPDILNDY